MNEENLLTLCVDCHDEVEPLGLDSRSLIENLPLGSEAVQRKEVAPETLDWRAWVYGGYTRPRQFTDG